MRKIISLFFVLFASISVSSQISKGDYSILVIGNYSKGSNSNGVSTNSFSSFGEIVNASISVEKFRTSNYYIGIGIDFQWGNDNVYNYLASKNFTQFENMNVKAYAIIPSLKYGYYLPIADNLFFNVSTDIGFGLKGSYYISDYQNYQHSNGGTLAQTITPTENLTWRDQKDYMDFRLLLSPEINYFLTDNFGLCLHFGGLNYSILDWNKDLSSLNLNINPNNWRLGIRFVL